MNFVKHLPPVLLGAAILSMIGFYNGYPLVYSDSGTYIYSGWINEVPIDRPIAYGFFIRLLGSFSLWTVLLAQNFLTSFILYQTFLYFFTPGKKTNFYFYLTTIFLTLFSAIAWYSNQIMPDFLTPVMGLGLFILFFQREMGVLKFILIALAVVFAIITHFSHLLIASLLAGILVVCNFVLFKKRMQKHGVQVGWPRALLVMVIACSGWLALPTLNKLVSGEFYSSKSSHVFFMASMADKGILTNFLKENCSKPDYADCKLCLYKDEIPRTVPDFIWDGRDSSVFHLTGGWHDSKAEYNKIIRATLIDPKYSSQHLYMSLVYGFTQLFENGIGHGLAIYRKGTAPYDVILQKYRMEHKMYINSNQANGGLVSLLTFINSVNFLLLMGAMLFLIYIYFSPDKKNFNRTTVMFISVMLLIIVLNAMITAGLSAPYGRYQARVTWLMELALIIFGIKNWEAIKSSFYRILKKPVND
jgi:hypothetical protein